MPADLFSQVADAANAYILVPGPPGNGVRWHFDALDPALAYRKQVNEVVNLVHKPVPTNPLPPEPEAPIDPDLPKEEVERIAKEREQQRQMREFAHKALQLGDRGLEKSVHDQNEVIRAGFSGLSDGGEVCQPRAKDPLHRCSPECFKTFKPGAIVLQKEQEDKKKARLWVGHIPPGVRANLFEAIVLMSSEGGRMLERLLDFRGEWSAASVASLIRGVLAKTIDLSGLPGFDVFARGIADRSDLPHQGNGGGQQSEVALSVDPPGVSGAP